MIRVQEIRQGKSTICEAVLRALPAWFGIEAATLAYIEGVDEKPMLVANEGDQVAGLISLVAQTECSAEIYVMGVMPAFHRQGVGRALIEAAEKYLRTHRYEFMTVKTVGPSRPDPGAYDLTRRFYVAMGFKPLEEFEKLWDGNPCLFMVKPLDGPRS